MVLSHPARARCMCNNQSTCYLYRRFLCLRRLFRLYPCCTPVQLAPGTSTSRRANPNLPPWRPRLQTMSALSETVESTNVRAPSQISDFGVFNHRQVNPLINAGGHNHNKKGFGPTKKQEKNPDICSHVPLRATTKHGRQHASLSEILTEIAEEMEKETHGTGGQTFYAPQIEHACRTHLHLYATINTQVMKSKVGEAWHTTNPIYTGVGATHEPITTFAKNRTTWIDLTTKKQ